MYGRTLIVCTVAALVACDDTTLEPEAEPCADYVIAVGDLQDGVVTDAEFRAEIRDVAGDAQGTEVEGILRDVLRELTSGTTDSALTAMRRAADVCTNIVNDALSDD